MRHLFLGTFRLRMDHHDSGHGVSDARMTRRSYVPCPVNLKWAVRNLEMARKTRGNTHRMVFPGLENDEHIPGTRELMKTTFLRYAFFISSVG
jgi:hypothetical protein